MSPAFSATERIERSPIETAPLLPARPRSRCWHRDTQSERRGYPARHSARRHHRWPLRSLRRLRHLLQINHQTQAAFSLTEDSCSIADSFTSYALELYQGAFRGFYFGTLAYFSTSPFATTSRNMTGLSLSRRGGALAVVTSLMCTSRVFTYGNFWANDGSLYPGQKFPRTAGPL